MALQYLRRPAFLLALFFIHLSIFSNVIHAEEEEIFFPGEDLPEIEEKEEKTQSQVNFGGNVKSQLALDAKDDGENESTFEMRNRLFVNMDFDTSEKLRFFFSAKLDHSLKSHGESETQFEGNLYEGYLELTENNWDLRFGKQRVVWGRSNLLRPVDNVNPLDLRGFIDPDWIDIKIPLLMATWDYYWEKFGLELLYIPFFEGTKFDWYGSDFSLLRPSIFDIDLDDEIDPSLRASLQPEMGVEEFPEDNFADGEAGIRLTHKSGNFEAAASYFYTWDDYPYIDLDPSLIQILQDSIVDSTELSDFLELTRSGNGFIQGEYKRLSITGLEINYNIGNTLVNIEGAYFDNKTFYTTELESIRRSALFYTVGLNYLLAVDIHFFQLQVLDIDEDLFLVDDNINGLTGFVKIPRITGGKIFPEVWAAYVFTNGDCMLGPRLRYSYSDAIEFSLGANIFEGKRGKLFEKELSPIGYYDQNDQIFITLKYSF